jgi:hypothetical protein
VEHEASDVAPTAAEYLPVTQSVHASGPATPLYVPARHLVQGPPLGPDDPALQVQSACSSLAAGALEFGGHVWHTSDVAPTTIEYLPSKQLVHEASPVATLYVPATHKVHALPSAPVEPGMQVQAAKAELPAGESEYDGQVEHDVAPITVQVPTNPARVTLPSDVKTTFRYGWLIDDVYMLELTEPPESFASSVFVSHDDDVH